MRSHIVKLQPNAEQSRRDVNSNSDITFIWNDDEST